MPNEPFGSVDQSQIQGLRRIFEAANSNAEQSAMLQLQMAQEKRYRQEVGAAADIYRQAVAASSKNPIVANNMLESTAAGLLQSRDPRSQKLAEHYGKIKFDVTPSVRSQEVINVKGLTPITRITEGRGTEGAVTRISEIGGRPIPKETDAELEALRKKNLVSQIAERGKPKPSETGADKIPDYQVKYLQARNLRENFIATSGEAKLKEWNDILMKEAPEVAKQLDATTGEMDFTIAMESIKNEVRNKGLLDKLDPAKLREVALFRRASVDESAYGTMLKKHDQEYDPETNSFVKFGTKKPTTITAPTQATKKWTPPVSVQ